MTDQYTAGRAAIEAMFDAAQSRHKDGGAELARLVIENYDAILALLGQDPEPVGVTLGALRPIWRKHGGGWHGPRVETWTIPEDNVKAAFTEILSALTPGTPQEAARVLLEADKAKQTDLMNVDASQELEQLAIQYAGNRFDAVGQLEIAEKFMIAALRAIAETEEGEG